MVSEARTSREAEREGGVEPSRECLTDHVASGSSTETASFCCHNSSSQMHGRGLPETAWQRQIFGMLRRWSRASPGLARCSACQSEKFWTIQWL